MQREPDPHRRPEPQGAEAWVPQVALAIVQLVLVVALVVFVFVVRPMQGRIALPPWTIPAATTFCGLFAAYLLVRAIYNVRSAYRGWQRNKGLADRS
jgi:hypothetical protein